MLAPRSGPHGSAQMEFPAQPVLPLPGPALPDLYLPGVNESPHGGVTPR